MNVFPLPCILYNRFSRPEIPVGNGGKNVSYSAFTLSLDETGIVKSILTDNASPAQQQTIKRLMDLGLIENTKVTCVGVSAFGSPKAFLIRGAVLALRKEEASLILVKKIKDGSVL